MTLETRVDDLERQAEDAERARAQAEQRLQEADAAREELERRLDDAEMVGRDALDAAEGAHSRIPEGPKVDTHERHPHDLGKHTGGVISARIYNSGVFAVPNNTATAITFDSERYDTDSIHSTSSNTSRLTCKTAGKYHISTSLGYASNTTGRRYSQFRVNGTAIIALAETDCQAVGFAHHAFSTSYDLAVGDYVEVLAYQNSGGALNVVAASNYSPEFMMERVGAAGTGAGGAPGFPHGDLTGLGDDDHTQYLLQAGSRALTGNWDAGAYEIRAKSFKQDLDSSKITVGTGSDGELYSSGDDVHLHNVTQDADLVFGIDDGGVSKTITWDADVDKLKHSAGVFNFDDDNIITTGTITCEAFTATVLDGGAVVVGGYLQLDTTNNPDAVVIANAGTGTSILFTHSGATGTGIYANFTYGTSEYTGDMLRLNLDSVEKFAIDQDGNVSVAGTLGVTGVATLATSSTIGNLTLANGSITDSGGAISFGDENLSTSGTLATGSLTATGTHNLLGTTVNVGSATDAVNANFYPASQLTGVVIYGGDGTPVATAPRLTVDNTVQAGGKKFEAAGDTSDFYYYNRTDNWYAWRLSIASKTTVLPGDLTVNAGSALNSILVTGALNVTLKLANTGGQTVEHTSHTSSYYIYNRTGGYYVFDLPWSTRQFQLYRGLTVNEDGADADSRIEGLNDVNLLYTDAGNDRVGISTSTPDAQLEIESYNNAIGVQLLTLDQDDADQAFVDYQGTSAASAANNISTWTTGNSIQGFIRNEINGVVYWMPYYDAPTS